MAEEAQHRSQVAVQTVPSAPSLEQEQEQVLVKYWEVQQAQVQVLATLQEALLAVCPRPQCLRLLLQEAMVGETTFLLEEQQTTGARKFGLKIATTLEILETLGLAVVGTTAAVEVAAKVAASTGVICSRIRIAPHRGVPSPLTMLDYTSLFELFPCAAILFVCFWRKSRKVKACPGVGGKESASLFYLWKISGVFFGCT